MTPKKKMYVLTLVGTREEMNRAAQNASGCFYVLNEIDSERLTHQGTWDRIGIQIAWGMSKAFQKEEGDKSGRPA